MWHLDHHTDRDGSSLPLPCAGSAQQRILNDFLSEVVICPQENLLFFEDDLLYDCLFRKKGTCCFANRGENMR
jgi:hypothetical protein